MSKKQKNTQPREGSRPSWREASTFTGGPGRAWTGIAAPVFLVVIVLIAAAVVFWPRGADTTGPSTGAPTTPDEAVSESVCPAAEKEPDAGDPPADLSWVAVQGFAWPISASVGPKVDADGVSQCFDRSPIGAALAAVNAAASIRSADVDEAHLLLDTLFVDNAGRDVSAESIDELYPTTPPSSRPATRQMGYRVLAFNDDLARIQLVEELPGAGQFTGTTYTLRWMEGDWRVELEDDGNPSDPLMITVDPDSFTRWVAAL